MRKQGRNIIRISAKRDWRDGHGLARRIKEWRERCEMAGCMPTQHCDGWVSVSELIHRCLDLAETKLSEFRHMAHSGNSKRAREAMRSSADYLVTATLLFGNCWPEDDPPMRRTMIANEEKRLRRIRIGIDLAGGIPAEKIGSQFLETIITELLALAECLLIEARRSMIVGDDIDPISLASKELKQAELGLIGYCPKYQSGLKDHLRRRKLKVVAGTQDGCIVFRVVPTCASKVGTKVGTRKNPID